MTNTNELFVELDEMVERVSKKTGKSYKKWTFVGHGHLPNLRAAENQNYKIKGKMLIIETAYETVRYHLDYIDAYLEPKVKEEVLKKEMYTEPVAAVSVLGEPLWVIGEQTMRLENGAVVEQLLYHIVGYEPANGKPFAALAANILLVNK